MGVAASRSLQVSQSGPLEDSGASPERCQGAGLTTFQRERLRCCHRCLEAAHSEMRELSARADEAGLSDLARTFHRMRRAYISPHVELQASYRLAEAWAGGDSKIAIIGPSTSALEASPWLAKTGLPMGTTSNRNSRYTAQARTG